MTMWLGYVAFRRPFVIGFLGFTIIPMIVSMYYSMTDYNLVNKENWVGLANYAALLTDARFQKSILVTFKYVLIFRAS